MEVREVMTPNPIVVEVSKTVAEAIDLLFSADVRHLPVVDEGILVGIVSDRDVRSFTFPLAWNEETLDETRARADERVDSVMSGGVIAVQPHADLSEVIDLMIDQRVGAVPVVDPEDNVVGIVSYIDVLRVLSSLAAESSTE